jgi:polyhydroxyalkanoate synthesis regulator phasin
MPKKKNRETQKEQSERFKKAVQDMIDAGELNPTEADEAFNTLVGRLTNVGDSNQKSPDR